MEKVTNDGKRGGSLVGKPHNDKSGKDAGGIKAVVSDAGNKPVELEGGEVIINKEASKKHWKLLSKINQSAGNGVPIEKPIDPHDEDPSEEYERGGTIDFNVNHVPNKWIISYAKKIKENHPEIWKLGGNIFGNEAFKNLSRVSERGYWLDSEEWMYKKWQSFLARHQHDFRIAGVVAVLKWGGKVNKGWAYMKDLIEAEIKKRSGKPTSMKDGGKVNLQIKDKDGDIVTLDNYTNIDYLNRDELNYDVLRNFATLKMLAKAGFIELHEDTGQRYSNKFEKIGTKKSWYEKGVSIIRHDYIKSAKKPKFEYKGREFAIGYRKVSDYVELYVLEYDPYLNKSKDGDGRIEIAEDDKMKDGGKVITYKMKFNKKYGFEPSESHSLAEIAKLTKLKLSALQDIYDKGIGAYKTNPQSVRPNVKSKEQWAMARVYSAVMGGKAAKVDANELERGKKYRDGGNVKKYTAKKEAGTIIVYENGEKLGYLKTLYRYNEVRKKEVPMVVFIRISDDKLFKSNYIFQNDALQYIKDTGELFFDYSENIMAKGGLIAPNGKQSNLTPEQYKLVRTKAFKNWFGDWENSPETASKVVDENGEPLVVYHGGRKFNEFKKGEGIDKGIYFSSNKYFAQDVYAIQVELYERDKLNDYSGIPEEMLNSGEWDESYLKYSKVYQVFLNAKNPQVFESIDARAIPYNYKDGYDGLIAKYTDDFGYGADQLVVFNSNQIKLADGSNTTFDGGNADIRYAEGGSVGFENDLFKALSEHDETSFADGGAVGQYYDPFTYAKIKKIYVSIKIKNELGKVVNDDNSIQSVYEIKSIDENPFIELEDGILKGVLGVSGSPYNISDWLVSRECLVLMDLEKFVKINNTEQILYKDADYLMSNEMEVFFRLYNRKQREEQDYIDILSRIFKHLTLELETEAQISPNSKALYYYSQITNHYNSSNFLRWVGKQKRVSSLDELAALMLEYVTGESNKSDSSYWQSPSTEAFYPATNEVIKAIRLAVLRSARAYRDESEWLIKDAKLKIPEGSQLFFVLGYYENYQEKYEELISKYNLRDKYKVFFIRDKDINKYQQMTWNKKEVRYRQENEQFKKTVDSNINKALDAVINEILISYEKGIVKRAEENFDTDEKKLLENEQIINLYNAYLEKFVGFLQAEKASAIKTMHNYPLYFAIDSFKDYLKEKKDEFGDEKSEYIDEYGNSFYMDSIIYGVFVGALFDIPKDEIIGSIKERIGSDIYRIYKTQDIRFKDGGNVSDFSKVISSSSRFKPKETIVFNPPLIGTNGAKLTAYTWAYEMTMLPNREGELVGRRVSDWTQAEMSAETGRDIVHQYTIELPNGDIKTVSSESVPIILGFIDKSQAKVFGNLATASKTLAKQQMKLAIMEAQKKEYDDLVEKFTKEPKPSIRLASSDEIPFAFQKYADDKDKASKTWFVIGDVVEGQDNPYTYKDGNVTFTPVNRPSNYLIDEMTSSWIKNRVKEAGGLYPSGLYELKNRVDRQKRKVEQMLNTQKMEDGGVVEYHLGGDMTKHFAPNGMPSNLTHEQWHLVRTPEFKAWFGDWEKLAITKLKDAAMDEITLQNLSKDVSKIVDENGEPLVVYHGSRSEFNVFDIEKSGESNTTAKVGFWFSPIRNFAENFASSIWYGKSENETIYTVYLAVKNPKIYESEIVNEEQKEALRLNIKQLQNESLSIQEKWVTGDWDYKDREVLGYSIRGSINEDNYEYYSTLTKKSKDAIKDGILIAEIKQKIVNIEKKLYGVTYNDSYERFRTDIYKVEGKSAYEANIGGMGMALNDESGTVKKYVSLLKDENYDGIIIKNTRFDKSSAGGLNDQYVAFNSNQIKLADGSNTTFDGSNADIRFDGGGRVEKLIEQDVVDLKMYDTTPEHAKEYGIDANKPLYVQNLWVSENERLKGIGKEVLNYLEDYARKNGNDVIFGYVESKASFSKDSRQTFFSDVEIIKYWLHRNGYAINDMNNDFHKVILKHGGELKKGIRAEIEHRETIEKFKRAGVSDKEVATSIAQDHLDEDPNYYTKMDEMESEMAKGGLVVADKKKYYSYINDEQGVSSFQLMDDAKPVKLYDSINNVPIEGDYFSYKNKSSKTYNIIEATTGMAVVTDQKTLNWAKSIAATRIIGYNINNSFQDLLQGSIDKNGLSPRYTVKPVKTRTPRPPRTPKPQQTTPVAQPQTNTDYNRAAFSLQTPTNEPSRLSYLQQILVRTKAFKEWFGDWELAAKSYLMDNKSDWIKHYNNISKCLDSVTLEPKLVYHGTRVDNEFFEFDVTMQAGLGRPYAYFAHNREYSENFTQTAQRPTANSNPYLYTVFLRAKNPFIANTDKYLYRVKDGNGWLNEIINTICWDLYKTNDVNEQTQKIARAVENQIERYVLSAIGQIPMPFWTLMARDTNGAFKAFLMSYKYDSIFYGEEIKLSYDASNPAEYTQAITIFNPTDIKLGDGRNLNFNPMKADIRLEKGGNLPVDNIEQKTQNGLTKKEQLSNVLFGNKYEKGGNLDESTNINPPKNFNPIEPNKNREFVDDLIFKMKFNG